MYAPVKEIMTDLLKYNLSSDEALLFLCITREDIRLLSSICRMAMSLSRIRGNVSRSQILIGKMGFISQMQCLSLRKSRARNWCLAGMEGLLIQPVMWFSGLMKGAQILFR